MKSNRVFIRPSASGGRLGGVARSTFEAVALCEAAGFNFIFVEAVGVGQSETVVSKLTDCFLFSPCLELVMSYGELKGHYGNGRCHRFE